MLELVEGLGAAEPVPAAEAGSQGTPFSEDDRAAVLAVVVAVKGASSWLTPNSSC